MRNIKIIIFAVVGLTLIVGVTLFLAGAFNPKGAGILIETTPTSSVFINGEFLGRAPYEEVRKPGEVTLKLVPDSFEKPLAPYETKVNLVSGVQTVVRWEFGGNNADGAGEIISFEKASKEETALSVVTIPASSQVSIDGATPVFTPYKTSSITPGEHTLLFSSEGFSDRSLRVKTTSGYKLTAVVQLAESTEVVPEPTAMEEKEEQPEEKVEVEILSTPTGFLRVREEPSTLGTEIGQVEPGERYPFVEEDEETGWFLIEYKPAEDGEEAETGWVSNTYAKKIEENASDITPTLTPTP